MVDLLEKHIGEIVEVIYYDEKGIHTITGILKSFDRYNYVHLNNILIPIMNMYTGIRQISSVNEFNDVIKDNYGYKTPEEALKEKTKTFGSDFVKVYNLKHPNKPIKF